MPYSTADVSVIIIYLSVIEPANIPNVKENMQQNTWRLRTDFIKFMYISYSVLFSPLRNSDHWGVYGFHKQLNLILLFSGQLLWNNLYQKVIWQNFWETHKGHSFTLPYHCNNGQRINNDILCKFVYFVYCAFRIESKKKLCRNGNCVLICLYDGNDDACKLVSVVKCLSAHNKFK